ncbi:MAG: transcriptional regulator BetI [Rhodobacteraceae bacterium]|nr:transcriptional regulator BetI [Paracoccaceae bacterium]
MPKLGMEPIRRDALVKATIAEVGRAGSLDVTVAQIARAAGMSPALAHHYFGAKEAMFVAAMRYILGLWGAEVRGALRAARTPAERVEAVIAASFSPINFRQDVVAAWLMFYVEAQRDPGARRLLRVYQRRLASTLTHALRPTLGDRARAGANRLGALIDGLYIRAALADGGPDAGAAAAMVRAAWHELEGRA